MQGHTKKKSEKAAAAVLENRRECMNHIKYRACLIAVLVAAVVVGILYYLYGGEEADPFSGATLVKVEEQQRQPEWYGERLS